MQQTGKQAVPASHLHGAVLLGAYYCVLLIFFAASLATPPTLLAFCVHVGWLKPGSTQLEILTKALVPAELALAAVYIRAAFFAFRQPTRGLSIKAAGLPHVEELVQRTFRDLRDAGFEPCTFTHTFLVSDVNAMTSADAGRRILYIGWPLLRTIGPTRMQAILAHEYAHHAYGSMEYHRATFRIIDSIELVIAGILRVNKENVRKSTRSLRGLIYERIALLAVLAAAVPVALLWLARAGLERLMRRTDHAFELYCDRVAASVYGADEIANALLDTQDAAFDWARYAASGRALGVGNVFAEFRAFRRCRPRTRAEEFDFRASLANEQGRHPSILRRIIELGLDPDMVLAERYAVPSAASSPTDISVRRVEDRVERELHTSARRDLSQAHEELEQQRAIAALLTSVGVDPNSEDAATAPLAIGLLYLIEVNHDGGPAGWQGAIDGVADLVSQGHGPTERAAILGALVVEDVIRRTRKRARSSWILQMNLSTTFVILEAELAGLRRISTDPDAKRRKDIDRSVQRALELNEEQNSRL
jgi:Zn-dependent protease with chaperone function